MSNYNAKLGRLPEFIKGSQKICDSVLAFERIIEEIEIEQYLKPENDIRIGCCGYCQVNVLKTVLYGFMDTRYVSFRELKDRHKGNLRTLSILWVVR